MGMNQNKYPPYAPVQPYAPMNVQAPPTAGRDGLLRQVDSVRLLAIGILAAIVGAGLAFPLRTYLGDWVFAAFGLTTLTVFLPLWYYDTMIRSGYFMRRMELEQELDRIEAANNKVDAGQTAQIVALQKSVADLTERVNRLSAGQIVVSDNKGKRVLTKVTPEDQTALDFIRDVVFGPGPTMQGIYKDGMLKKAYPYRPGSSPFGDAVHRRLESAGLIGQPGLPQNANYYYVGPTELAEALDALRRLSHVA